jgi:5-methylcytosine-specific restriction enzyme A
MARFSPSRKGDKLCSYAGCRTLTKTGRCERHTLARVGSRQFKEGKQFLNSSAWQRLRALKIQETPWCELCALTSPQPVPATDVDHIRPRHSHPRLKLEMSNLQSLCKSCHSKKTARGD